MGKMDLDRVTPVGPVPGDRVVVVTLGGDTAYIGTLEAMADVGLSVRPDGHRRAVLEHPQAVHRASRPAL